MRWHTVHTVLTYTSSSVGSKTSSWITNSRPLITPRYLGRPSGGGRGGVFIWVCFVTFCLPVRSIKGTFKGTATHLTQRFTLILIYTAVWTILGQVSISAVTHRREHNLKCLFTLQVRFFNSPHITVGLVTNHRALNKYIEELQCLFMGELWLRCEPFPLLWLPIHTFQSLSAASATLTPSWCWCDSWSTKDTRFFYVSAH